MEVFNVLMTFSLLYYAGQALELRSNHSESLNYFTFIFMGEISLIIPMCFADKLLSIFLNFYQQGMFATLLSFQINPFMTILKKGISEMIFPVLRVLLLCAFAISTTDFSFNGNDFLVFVISQIVGSFIYLILAFCSMYLYWNFQRGIKFFYTFQSVTAILGGQFFPLDVLPVKLSSIVFYLPTALMLNISRAAPNGLNSLLVSKPLA
jgi:ABC-type multidrug transport system permease subunit